MNQDETLATALHEAAAGVPVGTAPTAAVMRRGKMIRRRHKAIRAAAATAAVLVPVVGVAYSATFDSSPTPPVPAASDAAPWAVKVVNPGEKVMLGRDGTMWLTEQGMFLRPKASVSAGERLMKPAEVPEGKVSVTAAGDGGGTVWGGVYRGPATPTEVTLSLGGRTVSARIVTLPGRPGWVAFHADDAHAWADDITVTVKGADGAILASLAKSGKR
ncbi:hypothetical protein ACFVT5_14880 [Streptomyces sp. NPDC058001]|uniref:hypothetical protein n=1 Tax=Streptomyces sp. NPDC058001 TaxID=3346300 RepID=UPI0036E7F7D9